MAWIESHQTLKDHPKIFVLTDALNISRVQAIGHLHLLWWWCVDYSPDGIVKHSDTAIARAAEWSGESKLFVESLITAGFIDRANGVLTIHDWMDFCGPLMKRRLERKAGKTLMEAEQPPLLAERPPTNPTNHTVPDQTNQTKPTRDTTGRFERPTALQVAEYAKTIGFNLQGQTFIDHYEANGWYVGKSKMRDWKATVRNWKNRGTENGHKKHDAKNLGEIGAKEPPGSKFSGVVRTVRIGGDEVTEDEHDDEGNSRPHGSLRDTTEVHQ